MAPETRPLFGDRELNSDSVPFPEASDSSADVCERAVRGWRQSKGTVQLVSPVAEGSNALGIEPVALLPGQGVDRAAGDGVAEYCADGRLPVRVLEGRWMGALCQVARAILELKPSEGVAS